MLQLHSYHKEFESLDFVIAYLRKNEALNNKILSDIPNCKSKIDDGLLNNSILYVTKNEKILNAAIISNEKLVLSGEANLKSISLIIEWIIDKKKQLQKILGPKYLVSLAVSKLLEIDEKITFEIGLETYLMKLVNLKPLLFNYGHFRAALKKDAAVVSTLVDSFLKEALNIDSNEFAKRKTRQLIEQKYLYLLQESENIVSIAAIGRNLQKTVAITYVYTPLRFRKKGYASNCVYQLSKYILKQMNKNCILFADKHNKHSQKMYQNLGYQPMIEFQEISLNIQHLI